MGYYTRHKLTVLEGDKELISELLESCEEASYGLQPNGDSEESTKWYEHNKDMVNFSRNYPGNLFKLEGEGEEAGDIWIEYYKSGKCQECKAKITFDEFDEDKLK